MNALELCANITLAIRHCLVHMCDINEWQKYGQSFRRANANMRQMFSTSFDADVSVYGWHCYSDDNTLSDGQKLNQCKHPQTDRTMTIKSATTR